MTNVGAAITAAMQEQKWRDEWRFAEPILRELDERVGSVLREVERHRQQSYREFARLLSVQPFGQHTCDLCWSSFATQEELNQHVAMENAVDWPIDQPDAGYDPSTYADTV